jgi:hypothetical protein
MKKASSLNGPSSPDEFVATLEKFNSNLWAYYVLVPDDIARHFLNDKTRRMICRLNDKIAFQCALMPAGNGAYFINLNKKIRDTLGLRLGNEVRVLLKKDDSQYGLPMP